MGCCDRCTNWRASAGAFRRRPVRCIFSRRQADRVRFSVIRQFEYGMPYQARQSASLCKDTLKRSHQLYTLPMALASPQALMTRRFEYGMPCQAHQSAIPCKDTRAYVLSVAYSPDGARIVSALVTFGYGMPCRVHLSASCKGILAGLGPLHTPPMALTLFQATRTGEFGYGMLCHTRRSVNLCKDTLVRVFRSILSRRHPCRLRL